MATNTACWKFKQSSQVEPPQEITPGEAQAWCNFVLVMPGWLPADCRYPFQGSLRTEAPPGRTAQDTGRPNWTRANTSSFCTVAHGAGDRRLRIKQFLYDWAPPAGDHPSLWGNRDRPFSIDSKRVAWMGVDYKRHPAASGILWGTMCEATVEQGEFTEEELTRIFRELHPVDAEAKELIATTPFSKLSYWARHHCSLVPVPHSLWKLRRTNLELPYIWYGTNDLKRSLLALLPKAPDAWQIDSACLLGDADNPAEIDVLYVLGGRDRYLWCSIFLKPDTVALTFPPEKDAHPCQTDLLEISGTTVHHAWINDQFGPHDGMWERDGRLYLLQGNSAVHFDAAAFSKLLEAMIPEQVS